MKRAVRPKAAMSWSGGKDSCLAFHRTRQQFDMGALITMFTEDGRRSRSHGLRPEILQHQAEALGLELVGGRCNWQTYEAEFKRILKDLRARDFTHVVFGDILLAEHKQWVERVCGEVGLEAMEPLWGESTTDLLQEFLALGGKARIVSCKAALMDESWLGRWIDLALLPEFDRLGVDPCGENGEYHTVVTAAPAFRSPLKIQALDHSLHDGYWAMDFSTLA